VTAAGRHPHPMNENRNKTRKKSEQPWDTKKKRSIDRLVKPDRKCPCKSDK
jgi:hypothetical protein